MAQILYIICIERYNNAKNNDNLDDIEIKYYLMNYFNFDKHIAEKLIFLSTQNNSKTYFGPFYLRKTRLTKEIFPIFKNLAGNDWVNFKKGINKSIMDNIKQEIILYNIQKQFF